MDRENTPTSGTPRGVTPGSVTRELHDMLAGRKEAVRALWERYLGPCRALARRRLGHAARVVEEDDVVTEAFLSFCAAARDGKFPDLAGRDNVIRLLAVFTMRKACDARRKVTRRGDTVRTESVLGALGFQPFEGREPPPEFETEVEDLLARLDSDELREVALLRMHGYTREEIATRRKCSVATVTRRLSVIQGQLTATRTTDDGRQHLEEQP